MAYVPAICTQCGATIEVNTLGGSVCEFCGTPFVRETKVTQHNTTVQADTVVVSGANAEPLMKRGLLFLEDGDWSGANSYFDRVLDIDPEHAPAYVGKLCAQRKLREESHLGLCGQAITNDGNFQKALRFADDELRTRLERYAALTEQRLQKLREEKERKEAEELERKRVLEERMREGERLKQERLAQEAAERARAQARKNRILLIAMAAVALGILAAVIISALVEQHITIPKNYESAVALFEAEEYREAFGLFAKYEDYEDSAEYMQKCVAPVRETLPQGTIAAGSFHTLAVKEDGTVLAIGREFLAKCDTSSWTDIVAVSAFSYDSVLGLRGDGKVVAEGENRNGQSYVNGFYDVIAIASGGSHSIGLREDGSLFVRGLYDNARNWSGLIAVSASSMHTVGLRADGTVIATGENQFHDYEKQGELEVGDWTEIAAVAAVSDGTIGLKEDGTVVAVGQNTLGRFAIQDWKGIVAVAGGNQHTVGLRADGTVLAVGDNKYGQCDVQDWRDIVAVAAGSCHTVGLKSDGTVVAVGNNTRGQCGVSQWSDVAR